VSTVPSASSTATHRLSIEELRRAELIEAAVVTIHDRGFENATVRDIARAAGGSPASVLYYFKSKDELLAAAFEESDVRFRAMVRESIENETGFDKIARLIAICFPDGQVDSPLWSLQIDLWSLARRRAEFRAIFEKASADWLDIVESAVVDAVSVGDMRRIVSPRRVALGLAALIDGLAVEERATEHVTPSLAREIAMDYVESLRSAAPSAVGRRRTRTAAPDGGGRP